MWIALLWQLKSCINIKFDYKCGFVWMIMVCLVWSESDCDYYIVFSLDFRWRDERKNKILLLQQIVFIF